MSRVEKTSNSAKNPSGVTKQNTFDCDFPGCRASYRRKEHLNRHQARHTDQQGFECSTCSRRFRRSDTLRRHVQKRHGIIEPLRRARQACESCHAGKSRCEGGMPCLECVRRRIPCSFNDRFGTIEKQYPALPTRQISSLHYDLGHLGNPEKEKHYIDLYFEGFHPHWCFVHKGSFNRPHESPLLVGSMVVIGLWVSGEKSAQLLALELHDKLNLAIQDQKDRWDASIPDGNLDSCHWPIATYQALLLHILFSLLRQNGNPLHFDLKISLPTADLRLLEALVRSCRSLGMLYYPNILARYGKTDLVTFVWVSIEEVKRFNIALYKVCCHVSGSGIGDDVESDGRASSLLAASELQFPLPKNRPLWDSVGRSE